jgi:PleD family two-component response regulator
METHPAALLELVSGSIQARILVCDDDGDVRALVGTSLRDSGYTVWEANNPTLALQILEIILTVAGGGTAVGGRGGQ